METSTICYFWKNKDIPMEFGYIVNKIQVSSYDVDMEVNINKYGTLTNCLFIRAILPTSRCFISIPHETLS